MNSNKITTARLKGGAGIVFAVFLAALVVCAGVAFAWKRACDTFLADTLVTGEYIIEKGEPFRKTYDAVFRGQNTPPGFIVYLTKIRDFDRKIRYGYYEANAISLETLIDHITNGKQTLTKVTFPEGYNMYDVATAIENAGIAGKATMLSVFTDRSFVLTLTGNGYESLEGFLAPGTYFFSKRYPPEKIAAKMVNEFYKTLPLDFEAGAKKQGLSFYDALILASIVQKETYDEAESPVVAAVFLNRIKSRMFIQADPTIIYGMYDRYDGSIRKADITDRSNRFNTYRHKGLPPTPISNPSVMALSAVINPADSDYYYFVATKDGRHVFSKDYDDHRRNVRIYQLGLSR